MTLGKTHRLAAWLGAAFLTAACLLVRGSAGDASPETVPVQLIVVESPSEAEQIRNQLDGGGDFAALARAKSVDATSQDGGFLGNVDPEMLRPELRDALHGLEPGKLSRIVKIPSGYAILRILRSSDVTEMETGNRTRLSAVNANGSVRFMPDVGGLSEALSALQSLPKPHDWGQNLGAICRSHAQSYSTVMEWANSMLDPANPSGIMWNGDGKPLDVMQAYVAKGQLFAYQGKMDSAIEQFELAERRTPKEVPEAAQYIYEALGISHLHKAEMDNGVYHEPGEKCLFPIRTRFAKTADSQKAVQYFLKYLEMNPEQLEVKWLLNLAYMTLGQYPDGVPAKHLIPPSTFTSEENIGRFTDVAGRAGLNLFAMASGVIVDDFTNSGLFDVVTSSFDTCEPMHYFHNNGDGTFVDRAAKAGLSSQLGGLNLIQTDYNNDGCLDILVLRGAWEPGGQRKSLLRNNCNATFTDVTGASGLASPTNTQTAVWADIDNDGWLDLFVGNENEPAQLFRNKHDGTFEDISHAAGVDRVEFTKSVVAGDYDNDGYVDLYAGNLSADNFLYHNNGNGTFTETAKTAGVTGAGKTFASWFFDYDNDGWADLFVTSYYMSVDETARTYLKLPHNAGTLKLYKNLGTGAFRDVTKEVALDRVFVPMGANFGDVDNDGYPDLYLGTGNPSFGTLIPNVLLHNKEGKRFVDITFSSGTGELHKGHGIAFVDIDRDGDEDIVTPIGGAVPGDRHAMRLFENPGHGNDWISLKLVGAKANRAAIGARIKVTVKNQGQEARAIYRTVGSGGSFGASPLEQHIGLGKSAQIASIEIRWPGGKTPQTFTDVAKNQFLEINESSATYKKLDRRPYVLGGTKPKNTTQGANL